MSPRCASRYSRCFTCVPVWGKCRYLTIPVVLAHLESAERSWESLLAGVVACVAVNAVTVYVFLARPFAWHDGSLARFMW